MKKYSLLITTISLMTTCITTNPLLGEFSAPHGAMPFDKIKNEHYMPAFAQGMDEGRREIAEIIDNPAVPTFENTVAALDYSGELLARTSSIFFNLNEAETNDQMQQLAQEIMPLLTEYDNDISLNEKLFARIKTVYETTDRSALTPEQAMLLDKTYKGFTRSGANLSAANKEAYRVLSTKLSKLTLDFQQNVLAEINAYTLHLTDSAQLAGLPATAVEQAAKTAQEKGLQGWAFTLHQPSYTPFMKYAERRELRRELYMAFSTKCNRGNEHDNNETIRQIVNTRLQMAQLLGYATYADYALENRMAENAANVSKLLNDLLAAATPFGQKEVAEVQAYAKRSGATFDIEPYDWAFYAEKLQDEKYSISEELLRPYFEVEKVTNGIFALANKLYGISFKENASIPVYHPDVKVYEVFDADGSFLSLYYADLYPRPGKRSGAWMNDIQGQQKRHGADRRPHIINVCNFTKATASKPALLSFDEVTTFLHEFGHALHGMLAAGMYPSLTGTNVYRDFVELPSQIMENWATEKEFLDLFAVHYQTGEKIPAALVEKIIASRNYLAGYLTLRQLSFGLLDMGYHSLGKIFSEEIKDFEVAAIAPTQLLPRMEGTSISAAFGHIFSGGYAAGYYSYKWAEVLEADAYSLFKKNGIFDKATAAAFRKNILSAGGSEHPMALYKRFRGQEPTVDALLEKEGFKNN